MLHTEESGHGPRVVLAHGFTQNTRCWGRFADDLALDHHVVRVDAPGHGLSGHDGAGPWEAADLLAAAGGRGLWVGYSMGGRLALHVALAHPGAVEGLVLIGATGGIDDDAERAARLAADHALADGLEAEAAANPDDGLARFLERWLAGPLFATLAPEGRHTTERLANRPAGLAASLRRCGTGAQEPLWGRLGGIAVPVLVLAGEHDAKFQALAARLGASIGPAATVAGVAGAGHACHLERPHEVAALVRRWWAAHRPSGQAGGGPSGTA